MCVFVVVTQRRILLYTCCGVSAGAEKLLHCKRHYIMIISDFAVSANFFFCLCVCVCVRVCVCVNGFFFFFCYPKKDFAICCGVSAGTERLLHCKRHYIMIISDFAVSANFVCVCVCVFVSVFLLLKEGF